MNTRISLERSFKIVSGGQTGADRAALDWAIAYQITHRGWCPKGRKAEDGIIASRYNLQQFANKPATKELSNRAEKQTTMMKPIESIFISNSINSHSDCFIESIECASFSRTKNFF